MVIVGIYAEMDSLQIQNKKGFYKLILEIPPLEIQGKSSPGPFNNINNKSRTTNTLHNFEKNTINKNGNKLIDHNSRT